MASEQLLAGDHLQLNQPREERNREKARVLYHRRGHEVKVGHQGMCPAVQLLIQRIIKYELEEECDGEGIN